MADPVLHLLAGPNGAGKSTLHEQIIGPTTHLEFVNADEIAVKHWPDDAATRSYDAAALAADRRSDLIETRTSFVTETVFSHDSKLDLVRTAVDAGYLVVLHVVAVPEDLAVARVANREQNGGHAVSEVKVRERCRRLWPLVAQAIVEVHGATVYDNTRAAAGFRVVARFEHGRPVGRPDWPSWTPDPLRATAR
jgi:predicted ABC-type ATPase